MKEKINLREKSNLFIKDYLSKQHDYRSLYILEYIKFLELKNKDIMVDRKGFLLQENDVICFHELPQEYKDVFYVDKEYKLIYIDAFKSFGVVDGNIFMPYKKMLCVDFEKI